MKAIFTLLCVSFVMIGCISGRKTAQEGRNGQGIQGFVREAIGNQMPSPDVPPSEPAGIKTTVYVFELTRLEQVEQEGNSPFYRKIKTRMIDKIESDSSGQFAISLAPGRYSLFTKVNDLYYANNFDGENHIAPVTVEEGKFTEVNILISARATY